MNHPFTLQVLFNMIQSDDTNGYKAGEIERGLENMYHVCVGDHVLDFTRSNLSLSGFLSKMSETNGGNHEIVLSEEHVDVDSLRVILEYTQICVEQNGCEHIHVSPEKPLLTREWSDRSAFEKRVVFLITDYFSNNTRNTEDQMKSIFELVKVVRYLRMGGFFQFVCEFISNEMKKSLVISSKSK
jgi:hypothetical protein